MQHRNPGAPVIAFCLKKSEAYVQPGTASLRLCFQANFEAGHEQSKWTLFDYGQVCHVAHQRHLSNHAKILSTEIPNWDT
jgi:hypothetical protein